MTKVSLYLYTSSCDESEQGELFSDVSIILNPFSKFLIIYFNIYYFILQNHKIYTKSFAIISQKVTRPLKYIIFIFITCSALFAQNYSLRGAYGYADSSDLGQILSLNGQKHPANVKVLGLDAGYEISENFLELPWDFELKTSLYRFLEQPYQDNITEVLFYIKGYIKFDFLSNQVRLGVGEGVSYTSDIIYIEKIEAQEKHDKNSNILNYLEFSLDFDMGKLLHVEPMNQLFLGYALKHRSGIFGLYNEVKKGGSNYNMFYLEKKF